MPEGPEIRRAAVKLAAAIAGQRVTRMFFAFDRLQPYETGGITNDLDRATTLRKLGAPFEACRFHVYRRAGLSCYRCGTGATSEFIKPLQTCILYQPGVPGRHEIRSQGGRIFVGVAPSPR